MTTERPQHGVGDPVQYKAFGVTGDTGTVVKVIKLPFPVGGVRYRYRVKWSTYGAEGTESVVDDRVLIPYPSK